MPQQKALFLESLGGEFTVRTKDIEKVQPGEILVNVLAVALNPVDWKIPVYKLPFISEYPAILGSDTAGIVEEVGEGVTTFKKGDKVVHQGYYNNRNASFQQYDVVPAEIVAKIPDNITFEQASTLPLAIATAAEGLYGNANRAETGVKRLLPFPCEEGGEEAFKGMAVIVFGGSSSVGQYAIQFLKLSGFSTIISTASLHNTDLLKSIGVTHVIDRKADVVAEAKKILGGETIDVVYDAISTKETQEQALDILAPGGQVISVSGEQADKAKTTGKHITTVVGNVHLENVRALGVSLYSKLTGLLASGAIKPNRVELLPDGLAGIPAGLNKMEANEVSGVKLVTKPAETP